MTHSPLAAVLHFLWCPATRLWFHSQISVPFSTRDNNNNVIHSCGPSSGGGNDTSQSSIADQHSDTLLGEKAAAHHHHHSHLSIHPFLWRREKLRWRQSAATPSEESRDYPTTKVYLEKLSFLTVVYGRESVNTLCDLCQPPPTHKH